MDKDAKESKERIDPEREEMEKRGRQKERKKREEVHGELLVSSFNVYHKSIIFASLLTLFSFNNPHVCIELTEKMRLAKEDT